MKYILLILTLTTLAFSKGCYKNSKYYDVCPDNKPKPISYNKYDLLYDADILRKTAVYCIEGTQWLIREGTGGFAVQMLIKPSYKYGTTPKPCTNNIKD